MSDINAFSVLPARSRDYHLHDDFQGSGRKLTPENFPQGVNRIVDGLRQLLAASNMNQLCSTMGLFSKDLVWSTPSIIMSRKGHLRVSSYFSHFVANYDLEADTAQVYSLAGGRNMVQLEATMWVKPHRTWLLLPTLLLPKAVPLKVTYKIGVNGPLESGKIEVVHARLHNLPSLPLPIRAYAGVMIGAIPHATEFLWMPAAAFVAGDEFYRHKLNNVKDDVMDTTMDYVNWGQQTAKEVVDTTLTTARHVADTAVDTAHQIVGGVKETAYQTATKVQDTAYTAAGMAQEGVGTAVGVAAGTVEVGREVGQKAASTAYDAGQKAAATAYDTTAKVANRAAESAEDASLRARSAAATAKEGARITGQKTAAAASSPGGEAEHISSRQIPVVKAT